MLKRVGVTVDMLDKSMQCDGPKSMQLRYNIESLVSFYDEVKLLRRDEALAPRPWLNGNLLLQQSGSVSTELCGVFL